MDQNLWRDQEVPDGQEPLERPGGLLSDQNLWRDQEVS